MRWVVFAWSIFALPALVTGYGDRSPGDQQETPPTGVIRLRGDSLLFQTSFAFDLTTSALTLRGGEVMLENGDFGLNGSQFEM